MRQLKGGKQKESPKEKRDRKKAFMESREKVFTVVLPFLAVVAVIVMIFVYIKTRP
ncbi:protein of unknown function DUF4519, partial [Trinorchestia longiramus]